MQKSHPLLSIAAFLLGLTGALLSTSVFASTNLPGVGIVIKKKPGNAPIIAPSDQNGDVRLTGLAAGEYEVKLIGSDSATSMKVGSDGKLAFVAKQDDAPAPRPDKRLRMAKPVEKPDVKQWVEPIAFGEEGGSGTIIAIVAARADVNTGSAADLMADTNISAKTAEFIVADRQKNGAYKDPQDFANRVCSSTDVDFGYTNAQIGNAMIIARGGNPKEAGWKCATRNKGEVEIYNKKHNYVGHVTLLR